MDFAASAAQYDRDETRWTSTVRGTYTQQWAALPNGYRIEVIAVDSRGGTFAAFNALLAAHREEIIRGLLGVTP